MNLSSQAYEKNVPDFPFNLFRNITTSLRWIYFYKINNVNNYNKNCVE